MGEAAGLNYEFFASRYETIRILSDTDRLRTELVFYKPNNAACILKVYYGRDLSGVYSALKKIRHRNLIVVYDVLVHDRDTYIIEEMVDGETLKERMDREGVCGEDEVIALVRELCRALRALHGQNPPLIHKDIKPENVMIRTDGGVKLIDFDASRFYREKEGKDTRLLGTEEYASPEHYGYGQTSPASDIYSLGVMMHEMLTGKSLEKHRVTYRGRLGQVIRRCVQVDAGRRFRTVEALDKELASYQSKWGFFVRNRKKLGVAAGVALLLAPVACGQFIRQNRALPNLEKLYENDGSPFEVLNNPKIEKKMQGLLGAKYSYVEECLNMIDEPEYSEEEGVYFFEGGIPGLYTICEAAVSVTQDGRVECAFLEDGVCRYYASDPHSYEAPSESMLRWMAGQMEKPIRFHENQQFAEPEHVGGTYVRSSQAAALEVREKDGKVYVEGNASWGANVGYIEGVLEKGEDGRYCYKEGTSELTITFFEDCAVVTTVSGSFGGLNASLDGCYRRQGGNV